MAFVNGKMSWDKYVGTSLYKVWDFPRVLWTPEHLLDGFLAQGQGEEQSFYYPTGQAVGMSLARTLSVDFF